MPDNLKAKATLWLWELRDVAVICLGLLFSALIIAQWGFVPPLVATFLYAFLSIRMDDAVCFLFLRQYYEWRDSND